MMYCCSFAKNVVHFINYSICFSYGIFILFIFLLLDGLQKI